MYILPVETVIWRSNTPLPFPAAHRYLRDALSWQEDKQREEAEQGSLVRKIQLRGEDGQAL